MRLSGEQAINIEGHKDVLNDWIWDQTKGIVQSGPFKGMQLIKEECWKDGNIGTKCLGCYEADTHVFIEQEIERLAKMPAPKIVNVGCAEGYYAVGLARRLPNAKVWIVDNDPDAIRLAAQVAQLNGVSLIANDELCNVMENIDFVVMDCEGAEVAYLDLEAFPSLTKATLLVESHDFKTQHTTDLLCERFSPSHTIWLTITEGHRNPNDYEILHMLPSYAKWAAISEGRPACQYFLLMRPRDA